MQHKTPYHREVDTAKSLQGRTDLMYGYLKNLGLKHIEGIPWNETSVIRVECIGCGGPMPLVFSYLRALQRPKTNRKVPTCQACHETGSKKTLEARLGLQVLSRDGVHVTVRCDKGHEFQRRIDSKPGCYVCVQEKRLQETFAKKNLTLLSVTDDSVRVRCRCGHEFGARRVNKVSNYYPQIRCPECRKKPFWEQPTTEEARLATEREKSKLQERDSRLDELRERFEQNKPMEPIELHELCTRLIDRIDSIGTPIV